MSEEPKKSSLWETIKSTVDVLLPDAPKGLDTIEKEHKAKAEKVKRDEFLRKQSPPDESKRPPTYKTSMGEDMGEFGKKWDDTFA